MLYTQSDRKVLLAVCSLAVIAFGVLVLFSGNINISFSKKGYNGVADTTSDTYTKPSKA